MWRKYSIVLWSLIVFIVFAAVGACVWFDRTPATKACVVCHEMRGAAEGWRQGVHTNVQCTVCHEGLFASGAGFVDGFRRLWRHATDTIHPTLGVGDAQLDEGAMCFACGRCHASRMAQWLRSAHVPKPGGAWDSGVSCLRCHQVHAPAAVAYYSEPEKLFVPVERDQLCAKCHSGRAGSTTSPQTPFKCMRDMSSRKEKP